MDSCTGPRNSFVIKLILDGKTLGFCVAGVTFGITPSGDLASWKDGFIDIYSPAKKSLVPIKCQQMRIDSTKDIFSDTISLSEL